MQKSSGARIAWVLCSGGNSENSTVKLLYIVNWYSELDNLSYKILGSCITWRLCSSLESSGKCNHKSRCDIFMYIQIKNKYTHIYVYIYMYIYIYIHIFTYMYIYMLLGSSLDTFSKDSSLLNLLYTICIHTCVYICIHTCVYLCIYVSLQICRYTV